MKEIVYKMCKNKINMRMYETQEDMQIMLDVFLAGERITIEYYKELTALLIQKEAEKTA